MTTRYFVVVEERHTFYYRKGTILVPLHPSYDSSLYRAVACCPEIWTTDGWRDKPHDGDPNGECASHAQSISTEYCLKPIELPTLPPDAVERYLSEGRATLAVLYHHTIPPTDSKGEPL